ncbi:MAG: alpha-ketoglutarate-dependent dioxygenase AlkB [Verrucomicrobiota bacterium]
MGYEGFDCFQLDEKHDLWRGWLPDDLRCDDETFEEIWNLHPPEYHDVRMHGRWVKTPRWQQAYNRDYTYTGSKNNALPTPPQLQEFVDWTKQEIDSRLNGILLNWYDAAEGHYIGKHRDKTTDLIPGSPIVTISLGEGRKFRLRPWRGEGFQDFDAVDGSVFVLPFDTNETWTHEVPHSKKHCGRRISITIRAFAD